MIASPELHTSHGLIRLPTLDDAPKLLRYRLENREHLAPWEPLRAANYYTLAQCRQAVMDAHEAAQRDRGYALALFDIDDQHMLGSVTLSNVVRGSFQACHLGYGIGSGWQGRGLMREALEATLAWAFTGLDLHRVMANHLPHNTRSASLLERLGFEREGYARAYLKIAGVWQDHVLTANIRAAD